MVNTKIGLVHSLSRVPKSIIIRTTMYQSTRKIPVTGKFQSTKKRQSGSHSNNQGKIGSPPPHQ
jgi:hypothetical protein